MAISSIASFVGKLYINIGHIADNKPKRRKQQPLWGFDEVPIQKDKDRAGNNQACQMQKLRCTGEAVK